MVVGVTGGIGSGKSTVVKLFLALTQTVAYIADEEAKKLMQSSSDIKKQLLKAFGKEIFVDDVLQRSVLAAQVFGNNEKLQTLNAIVHPAVRAHFLSFIKAHKDELILYENAILFETQSDVLCDVIITVHCSEEVKIQRLLQRDDTTQEAIEKRMKSQWNDAKKMHLSNYIISNTSLEDLNKQVHHIHNILTKNQV